LGLSNVVAIACGDYHNLALKQNGTIVMWGLTTAGQTNGPAGVTNVVEIGAGGNHNLAVMNDGRPYFVVRRNPQTGVAGASIELSSTTLGQQPISYQWLFNGSQIFGATNSTFLLTAASTTNSGVYQCLASNNVGITLGPEMNVLVQRTIPLFSGASLHSDEGFQLKLKALSGHGSVIIHSSSNLLNWEPLWTNPPVVGDFDFKDASATNNLLKFYRAEEQ
jgi:hypothetical protein